FSSRTATLLARQSSIITLRVTPPRILWLLGGVITMPSFTMKRLLDAPSMANPSLIRMASAAPWLAASWLINKLGNKPMDFMSQRFQRKSLAVIALIPVAVLGWSLSGMAMGCTMANTVGAVVAVGNACSRLMGTPRVICK